MTTNPSGAGSASRYATGDYVKDDRSKVRLYELERRDLHCASDSHARNNNGQKATATHEFIAGGVGSYFCEECLDVILDGFELPAAPPPPPAGAGLRVLSAEQDAALRYQQWRASASESGSDGLFYAGVEQGEAGWEGSDPAWEAALPAAEVLNGTALLPAHAQALADFGEAQASADHWLSELGKLNATHCESVGECLSLAAANLALTARVQAAEAALSEARTLLTASNEKIWELSQPNQTGIDMVYNANCYWLAAFLAAPEPHGGTPEGEPA